MNKIEIESNKNRFIELAHQYIKRDGLDKLLDYLEKHTDFYTAPSSTRFHLNVAGGLCLHSINVFETALAINEHVLAPRINAEKEVFQAAPSTESIAISTLFHDVCKCNIYKQTEKWKKDENNRWVSYPGYEVVDDFPYGHGDKSCHLINYYMRLERDELLAIRWHMGAFDLAENGSTSRMSFYRALELTPLVTLVVNSDFMCSNCFEPTTTY